MHLKHFIVESQKKIMEHRGGDRDNPHSTSTDGFMGQIYVYLLRRFTLLNPSRNIFISGFYILECRFLGTINRSDRSCRKIRGKCRREKERKHIHLCIWMKIPFIIFGTSYKTSILYMQLLFYSVYTIVFLLDDLIVGIVVAVVSCSKDESKEHGKPVGFLTCKHTVFLSSSLFVLSIPFSDVGHKCTSADS